MIANLEARRSVLREIRSGARPPEDIVHAVDANVLRTASTRAGDGLASSTLRALDAELHRVHTQAAQRRTQIEKLREARETAEKDKGSARERASVEGAAASSARAAGLNQCLSLLVTAHLSRLLDLDPHAAARAQQVLCRLVEVTLRGEQLIVPKGAKIVEYLLECGLVRCEPAGTEKLRVRVI